MAAQSASRRSLVVPWNSLSVQRTAASVCITYTWARYSYQVTGKSSLPTWDETRPERDWEQTKEGGLNSRDWTGRTYFMVLSKKSCIGLLASCESESTSVSPDQASGLGDRPTDRPNRPQGGGRYSRSAASRRGGEGEDHSFSVLRIKANIFIRWWQWWSFDQLFFRGRILLNHRPCSHRAHSYGKCQRMRIECRACFNVQINWRKRVTVSWIWGNIEINLINKKHK